MVELAVVQYCAKPDVEKNIATIDRLLTDKFTEKQQNITRLVVLPECCLFFGSKDQAQLELAKLTQGKVADDEHNTLIKHLTELAIKHQIYLVAGSIPVLSNTTDEKFTNSCFVISPSGQRLGKYDKIHLFDVMVQDNEKNYLESRYTQAGQEVVTAKLPFAQLGLSICYDLRFPELYRSLRQQGADIITVPAAFTRVTGVAHWQALLQARAIENQVYILASGQEGVHENGRETWGHSMIISPWGEILAELPTGEGVISAHFEPDKIAVARNSIPVATHNQFTIEMNA